MGFFWVKFVKEYCHNWILPIMKNKKRLGVWDKKCLIWARLDQNLKNTKFHVKFITSGYFWTRIWKKLLPYLKSTPSNLSKHKLSCKKTLSFRPKISFLDSFRPKFEKIIVIFEISTFKSIKMQSFMLNNKKKFGTKIALFLSWTWIWKNYCHIWNKHPRVYQKWISNRYSKSWHRVCLF